MRVIINNFSRLTVKKAILMVFLKLNGNEEKTKERHISIEERKTPSELIFTVRDE